VILRSDGTRFAHAHAETTDGRGRPTFATPGSTFGPDLGFHTRFETAGTYRLWGQFRLPDGHVITTAFTVHPGRADVVAD
jgi:Cu+-exporting ATPase